MADPRPGLPLLTSLLQDHLDPGYAAAAERRAADGQTHRHHRPHRPRRLLALGLAAVAVAGVVLGIALRSTDDDAGRTASTRTALRDDITRAQQRQAELGTSVSALEEGIRAARAAAGNGDADGLAVLEAGAGRTAVTGPGLEIVIDGPEPGTGGEVILDRDIQLLVNGLYAAGAEAVAVGGVRLRTTSSIRRAGSSILVDNTPVFWPITIQAVGEKSALHVGLVSTAGFGRFNSFASLYEIRFDLTVGDAITLPAASADDLRYASVPPAPTDAAPTTAVATTR
ncbi:DUF881 domain-containing protein [Nakamurella sp. YIM 132087]|uniref:DUF881 domain-containing protein n=1 Tax=Nakamurella alba TaxID=2665158 RepID=A0A7K1FQZ9_9ACTN|nr:DUF881 domain-containing protein [Nakamurella alba]MTD16572.1 DUF881 domain-containing protein [Nakamurella alba]